MSGTITRTLLAVAVIWAASIAISVALDLADKARHRRTR